MAVVKSPELVQSVVSQSRHLRDSERDAGGRDRALEQARHGVLFDLTGRTAWVTGARTGIGRAIAVGFAQAGADVLLLGSRRRALDEVRHAVEAVGRCLEAVPIDLSDTAVTAAMNRTGLVEGQIP